MPQARLLDLTRLVSRLGRGPLTGIDRVEHAYLKALLQRDDALFALVRLGVGYALLDRMGAEGIAALVEGTVPAGPVDLVSKLTYRHNPLRAKAEASVRRLSIARSARPLLAAMLRKHLPHGTSYINTGHANLTDPGMRALHTLPGLSIAVLLHDMIPLDFPQYCRPDTIESFCTKVQAVSRHADLVIHTNEDARHHSEVWLTRMGRCPPGVVANLGVPLARPDPSLLTGGLDLTRPYFVALGTIEPRKNHALLLTVWEELAKRPDPPMLYIVGSRGWSNAPVFTQLDAAGPASHVRELGGLGDGAVTALLQGAQALLFPSHAEGFGLPPLEAAALGVPVISADLPVVRELLGDEAVYLDPTDTYSWITRVEAQAKVPRRSDKVLPAVVPPQWDEHFKRILSLV